MEAQQAHRRRFQHAVLYSMGVMSDPELTAAYESKAKPGQSARNMAVADFFHAPDIRDVDVTGYRGLPGDVIRIEVTDDFMVTDVFLQMRENYVFRGERVLRFVFLAGYCVKNALFRLFFCCFIWKCL
jgi:hypothetical protein